MKKANQVTSRARRLDKDCVLTKPAVTNSRIGIVDASVGRGLHHLATAGDVSPASGNACIDAYVPPAGTMVLSGMNRVVEVCCLGMRGGELSVALLSEWRYLRQAGLEQLYL